MSEWYIVFNGQQVGPMTKEQLSSYGLNPQSKVWKEGMPDWVEAYTQPELMEVMPQAAPAAAPTSYAAPQQYVSTTGKSNTVAGILALLLGGFGAQYFYIGKIGGAFVTILLCWCTCGLWGIVELIQGIMMHTMSQEEFDRKYVNSTSFMPLF
mgnify:CR=1 FL=1